MSTLTLTDLLEMIATEHDPDRRRAIVQLAYIKGEIAGRNDIIDTVSAKLNAQEKPT